MLTKAQIKYIQSVTQHKFREEEKVFLAEGAKIAAEWLASKATIRTIAALPEWVSANIRLISAHPEAELVQIDQVQLEKISTLQTPNQVVLVVEMPEDMPLLWEPGWYLALDGIQDPGNMGTLIRIADWFGIDRIFCGEGCADVYNPKVVQSAMGGHLRVKTSKVDLSATLAASPYPVFAAMLEGTPLYQVQPAKSGILVVGNESKGISPAVAALCGQKVTIPGRGGAESLNAAVSAGILCAWLTSETG